MRAGKVAGFQIGRQFSLEFAGTDAEGAVVKMRSASIATIIELTEGEDLTAVEEIEIMARHLIEWNLEDADGAPLPATAAGVLQLEVPFKSLILAEWMKATRGITAPFDRRSDDGGQSPQEEPEEPSIPMETL